ncbi:MAG: hypothetical protein H8E57_07350 [Candidatus Cloacimonetes bacterium]|nr:hypothetical protein [Candidatus Cloacimonadota bacterium]
MKVKLKKIGVTSLAVIQGIIGVFFGIIAALFINLMMGGMNALSDLSGMPENFPVMNFGAFGIIIFPIIYGISGFIAGLIIGLLYNLAAGLFGGIELEMQE